MQPTRGEQRDNDHGTADGDDRDPLDVLAEEFVRRHRQGEAVSIGEYVSRFPHLADGIRRTFPAALVLESLKASESDNDSVRNSGFAAPPLRNGTPPVGLLGDFRMLREIGRGGMGVVYEAEQVSLGRRVAVKVLGRSWATNDALRRRFDIEARAAARLHHSSIVPVFGVGEEDGTCYYAMQFIQGKDLDLVLNELRRITRHEQGKPVEPTSDFASPESVSATELAQRLLDGGTQSARPPSRLSIGGGDVAVPDRRPQGPAPEAQISAASFSPSISGPSYWKNVASMGLQVAEALQYAHESGVLHRDIKPSNLMLDQHGRVWVTDFGLAKLDDQPQDLTREKDLVGTLRYMAPERLQGRCDARSDLYALGLVLYELLTLEPARPAADRKELLAQVGRDDGGGMRRPRAIDRSLPRDLETIVLKAASGRPNDRYSSAWDLADDLRRFLEDRPVLARRITAGERLARWCRRNPLSAGLAASVMALMAAMTVGSLVAAARFHRIADQRATAIGEANAARRDVESTLAELYPTNGLAAGRRGSDAEAALWFANAAVLARPGSEQAKLNGFRARTWGRHAAAPVAMFTDTAATEPVRDLRFEPGGRFLIARPARQDLSSGNGTTTLWDLTGGHPLALAGVSSPLAAAATSRDGRRLAVATATDEVLLFDLPALTRAATAEGIATSLEGVRLLAFSHDGNLLAIAAGGTVRLWDCVSGKAICADVAYRVEIVSLSFSPAANDLLIGTADGRAEVRRISSGTATVAFAAVAHPLVEGRDIQPLFVDGGRLLITIEANLLVWRRADTGEAARTTRLDASPEWIVADFDGRRVAVGAADRALVIESVNGQQVASVPLRRAGPCAAAMSADGMYLLITGRGDAAATLWAIGADGARLRGELEGLSDVESASFSPAGNLIAAAGPRGLVRVWRLPVGGLNGFRIPLEGRFASARFDATGRYVMAAGACWPQAGELRSTRVYDIETGAPAGAILLPGGLLRAADFSPDGQRVVTLSTGGDGRGGPVLQFWDWRTGAKVGGMLALPSEPMAVRYDPRGARVAARCAGGQVLLVDAREGTVVRGWPSAPLDAATAWMIRGGGLAWSADGATLVTWGSTDAQVWDPNEGKLRFPPLKHESPCSDVHFSAHGEFIATAAWDRTVHVWDASTGRPATTPLSQDGGTSVRYPSSYSAQFAANDRELLVSSADGRVALWDWRGRRAISPLSAESDVAVVGGDSGQWILTGSDDRGVRLWDVATRTLAAPVAPTSGVPLAIEVAPGGQYAAVTGSGSSVDVFRLNDLRGSLPTNSRASLAQSELAAGHRLERGRLVRLSTEEWLHRWQTCRGSGLLTPLPDAAATAAWHRQQGSLAGDALDAGAERFHLRALAEQDAATWAERARFAELLILDRQWHQAADALAGALRLNPEDARLHRRRGDCLIAASNWDAAAAEFARAVQLEPGPRRWIRGSWWTVGPYPGGLSGVFPPETQTDVSKPVSDGAPANTSAQRSWRLRDEADAALELHHEFNWAEHVVGYAQTFIYSAEDEPAWFSLGSDDSLRLWLNGEKIFEHDGFLTPGAATAAVSFKKGWNRVLAKVANDRVHHSLYLKVLDVPPAK